jgi:isoquinoline 1-oxidoreductase/isoquinoline 1-oxidoreductase beta subunit
MKITRIIAAAALTNAIFAASGKRVRKLPVGDQVRTAPG